MTEENVNLYEKLHNEFHETCEHIAQILSEYEYYSNYDILDADTYTLQTNDVWYDGRDKYNRVICGAFDRNYLTMTDGQIRKSAKQKNDEYLAELERKKEQRKAEKENAEYQRYLSLKQKFEN